MLQPTVAPPHAVSLYASLVSPTEITLNAGAVAASAVWQIFSFCGGFTCNWPSFQTTSLRRIKFEFEASVIDVIDAHDTEHWRPCC